MESKSAQAQAQEQESDYSFIENEINEAIDNFDVRKIENILIKNFGNGCEKNIELSSYILNRPSTNYDREYDYYLFRLMNKFWDYKVNYNNIYKYNDCLEILKLFLEYGIDINIKDYEGNTILGECSVGDIDSYELVQILLNNNYNINECVFGDEDWDLLEWFCILRRHDLVKLVLNYGPLSANVIEIREDYGEAINSLLIEYKNSKNKVKSARKI